MTTAAPGAARHIVELQAEVCFQNVDRTLATWTRTALGLMVFGTVVARFGLLMTGAQRLDAADPLASDPLSMAGGLVLIALGVALALAMAVRHQLYRARWIESYGHTGWHGPWLALVYALGAATAGLVLIAVLLLYAA